MRFFLLFFFYCSNSLIANVLPGVDLFFQDGHAARYKHKSIGIITNQTGVSSEGVPVVDLFLRHGMKVKAIFSPEHGFFGSGYAFESMKDGVRGAIPLYSLHGATRRPTKQMLSGIDLLVYDIQDVGCRTYTYISTLFYVIEEAAAHKIPVIVLDRPNPINGEVVDGTMLCKELRSFVGYVDIPYCHGMTVGELAKLFIDEYQIQADITVIPMKGWKRRMSFAQTGLHWIPTSPNMPEADTPLYYPITGILGEFGLINIGVGYTLPFKVIGAEWIDAELLAKKLQEFHLEGISFLPFHFKPFFGTFRGKECHGVLLKVTDPMRYRPYAIQMAILGMLKSLYPKNVEEALRTMQSSKELEICKAIGSKEVLEVLRREKYASWKLISIDLPKRESFVKKRQKYLIPEYSN